MTLRQLNKGQLDGYPGELLTALEAELTRLQLVDREVDTLNVKEIRQIAAAMNVPAEDVAMVLVERRCRVCGCTEYDCSECIERTGEPCHWIQDDLCSACEGLDKKGSIVVPKIIMPL